MRTIRNENFGDIMAHTPENEIRRSIGVEGSYIRPSKSYLDRRYVVVDITGFSVSEKAYVGIDAEGIVRLYNEYGECVELPNGEDNSGKTISRRITDYDIKIS